MTTFAITGAGRSIFSKSEHKRKFEAAIITHDETIIGKVMEQFDNLWRGTYCRKCKQKKFCADYKDILT